jgi:predicted membrane protein
MKTLHFTLCILLIALLPTKVLQAQSKEKDTVYRKSISLSKAKHVKTDISFFAGELIIDTSTDRLSECFYGFRNDYIEPYVNYRENDEEGYLTIKSKKSNDVQKDNHNHNKWKLELNKKVRNDIAIELMAGEAHINLENTNLENFRFKMMAGETHINLRNTSVPKVRCEMMAGEAHLDLSGVWKNDCDAEIKGGVGEIHVTVPFNTGVKVHVSGMLGEVHIPFFEKEGNTYTNDTWGKTKNEITLYLSGAIGEIHVDMEK